jgi:hypothetical protein
LPRWSLFNDSPTVVTQAGGRCESPRSGGVDHVEVAHPKTVFEVSDSATESATRYGRGGGVGLVHGLLELLKQFVAERVGGLRDGGKGGGHHDGTVSKIVGSTGEG